MNLTAFKKQFGVCHRRSSRISPEEEGSITTCTITAHHIHTLSECNRTYIYDPYCASLKQHSVVFASMFQMTWNWQRVSDKLKCCKRYQQQTYLVWQLVCVWQLVLLCNIDTFSLHDTFYLALIERKGMSPCVNIRTCQNPLSYNAYCISYLCFSFSITEVSYLSMLTLARRSGFLHPGRATKRACQPLWDTMIGNQL